MTQLDLLERAKQGDATAIAALMNSTLEPQGVTVQTELSQGCLHVLFTADRLLNQNTLINFTRRGLLSLHPQSIHTVRLYGQKTGDPAPNWVEELEIGSPASDFPRENRPESPVEAATPAKPDTSALSPRQQRNEWEDYLQPLKHSADQAAFWLQSQWQEVRQRSNEVIARFQSEALPPGNTRTPRRKTFAYRQVSRRRAGTIMDITHNPRFRAFAIALLPAFLLGGIMAIIASYNQGNSSASADRANAPEGAPSSEMVQSDNGTTRQRQEDEVRAYLKKMNKAQQTFYAKNNRFASSLEELERSAATISLLSQKYNYIYKLNISDGDLSQLTATPRIDGLKSFTGIVILKNSGTSADATVSTICETEQPAKVAPIANASANDTVQCPTGSSKSL
jgi:hypothetical protein